MITLGLSVERKKKNPSILAIYNKDTVNILLMTIIGLKNA